MGCNSPSAIHFLARARHGSDEITEQLMMNARNPQPDCGDPGFDIGHVVTLGGTYLIPGRRVARTALGRMAVKHCGHFDESPASDGG